MEGEEGTIGTIENRFQDELGPSMVVAKIGTWVIDALETSPASTKLEVETAM